ncbi:hypothetical protein ABZ372_54295, partial [Streptomyces sp. NPDC005921]
MPGTSTADRPARRPGNIQRPLPVRDTAVNGGTKTAHQTAHTGHGHIPQPHRTLAAASQAAATHTQSQGLHLTDTAHELPTSHWAGFDLGDIDPAGLDNFAALFADGSTFL